MSRTRKTDEQRFDEALERMLAEATPAQLERIRDLAASLIRIQSFQKKADWLPKLSEK